ncbi:DoxX family protein [Ornithinibacillus gellani]|uniref:DoxX family protein n=1 Tax=Ornithinibacillus gellani TaxID=2293253 RepID=UPI000F47F017|nr:DoxX family protein [Ornithinibacillus gellani]TQS76313.1 DoxX family protein [Ornithinibacillus gellani]
MKRHQRFTWLCYGIGYVFIVSGAMKLLNENFKTTFAELGIPFPALMLFIVAITEIACGAFIAGQIYLKQAVAPLILILIAAIILTKLPLVSAPGILAFAFEARLDIILILVLLFIHRHAIPNT